jgi:tetratricopeptide (TPR) repeat protein
MDTHARDDQSTGARDAFSDDVHARVHVDDFAEELRGQLLEQELRARMLGLESTPVKLGRWELREAIDQGAMGAVFRAFDPNLRRDVAIKLLICPPGGDLHERRARMEIEGRAMAQLEHPNVLKVQDYVPASAREDGTEIPSFLVMDFIEGTTLLQWQRDTRTNWRDIIAKYEKVARGLAHTHEQGLVHRDIKPANILVRRTREDVLICDFGLVHEADRGDPVHQAMQESEGRNDGEELTVSARMTREGTFLGTLAFMAPEQLRDRTTSQKSDQFSFFVALYDALYDRMPFEGDTPPKLLSAMSRALPVLGPGPRRVPRWLRTLIHRGLSVAPADRHPGMQVVADALAARLKPRSWGWTAAGVIAVTAMLGFGLLVRETDDPCRGLARLDDWSFPARAAAHAGFLSSGAEGGDSAWQRFSASADRFAGTWGQLKVDTCDAFERAGDGANAERELAGRRDECLDESAALLKMFMRRYQQARHADVYYSENAAFELNEALLRCTNDAQLLRGDGPSTSLEAAASVDGVRDGLANALVLEIGGELEAAAAEAAAALRAATDVGVRGLEAHALFRLGRILSLLRQDGEAVERLRQAFAAANAIGRDDVAAASVIELIKVLVLDVEDLSQAAIYEGLVESFVERIGGTSQRGGAAAAEARGILARAQGRRGDAIAHHRKALGLRHDEPETPTGDHIRSLVNLANSLTDPGHDAAAIAEARGLYEQAIGRAVSLGDAHPLTADVRRAYAVFLDDRGEYASARREAAAIGEVYGDRSRHAAVLHVLLGRLALAAPGESRDLIAARAHLAAALDYYEGAHRPGIVDSDQISALHLSAEVHRDAGELSGAVVDYERALRILRPSRDHQVGYAETLGYLGETLLEQKQPAEALLKLRAAWRILTLGSAPHEANHAFFLSAMATAEAQTGDLQRALQTAREAEEIASELGIVDDPELRDLLDPILNHQRSQQEQRK